MSNFFFIDSYGNAVISGNLTADGYTINPSNSSINQVLAYDGYAYVPTTISSGITGSFTNDQILFGNVANSTVQGSSDLTFDGTALTVPHFVGGNSSPSILKGSSIGATGSVSLSRATDTSGLIILIPGGSGQGAGIAATITFDTNFNTAPKVILFPANQTAIINSPSFTINGCYIDDANVSTTTFAISTTGSINSGTYKFYYFVIG